MIRKLTVFGAAAVALAACANTGANYTPIVDGPRTSQFESDLAACRQVAKRRGHLNDDTKSDAILGVALGALLGAVDGDGIGGALGGAAIGGATGAAAGAYEAKDERRDIVVNCMRGRGHRVVG